MITDALYSNVSGYIIHFVLILLAGYLLALIAKKIKIQPVLPILIIGILFAYLDHNYNIIIFKPGVIQLLSIIAFTLAAFEISSRIEIKKFDTLSKRTIAFVLVSFSIMIIIFSLTSWYMFGINIWQALILSCLMISIELGHLKNTRIKEILQVESLISNIITITVPLVLIQLSYKLGSLINSDVLYSFEQIKPWFILVLVGLGTGLLVSLIASKIIHHYTIKSKFALIIAVLIAFFLSELLEGSGLIAVLTTGFIFGNLYLRHKIQLHNISCFFMNMIEITAVFLAVMTVNFPITFGFIINSLVLFIVYLLIRFISARIVFEKHRLSIKESIYLTLNSHKGIVFLVVLLFLSTKINLMITNLAIFLMIYSIIASWFAKFIRI